MSCASADNDTLSALVAVAIGADELVLAHRLEPGCIRQSPHRCPGPANRGGGRNLAELHASAMWLKAAGQRGTGALTTKLDGGPNRHHPAESGCAWRWP